MSRKFSIWFLLSAFSDAFRKSFYQYWKISKALPFLSNRLLPAQHCCLIDVIIRLFRSSDCTGPWSVCYTHIRVHSPPQSQVGHVDSGAGKRKLARVGGVLVIRCPLCGESRTARLVSLPFHIPPRAHVRICWLRPDRMAGQFLQDHFFFRRLTLFTHSSQFFAFQTSFPGVNFYLL